MSFMCAGGVQEALWSSFPGGLSKAELKSKASLWSLLMEKHKTRAFHRYACVAAWGCACTVRLTLQPRLTKLLSIIPQGL